MDRPALSAPRTLQHEAVNTTLFGMLKQRIPGRGTECLEVGYRAGVGGKYLERRPLGQLGDCLFGLEDWQRAAQAFGIERFVGHGGLSGGRPLGYINECKCLATPFALADCDFAPACARR